ncbi:tRNA (N6-threonylcarbamoyladenosine(37)-N6)-methyltransferase TrmO [Oscillibacter sp.]|jgi:tRNA-Thr(GGU) m(6)t(6)A37 methyltransferase TsaA|uniref:tRNA (N6-threonylcarbamoyladenosine(37)-N6)-methyltransferase TrmO n=1 Tax=Oscillibacter sp. TaxID=1945593 RepID=UPI0021739201|nr:tRNA (N6-threonylcarbamoyladenosine(37)-N6)-methyltransferase TrmO [Oscillibacter sp.]MCI9648682.1 tRNA (N6-threonylcarbamoyladenosine(37)-N6)-methyltransferase TrmO [Oscillibacter sp.]
MSQEFSMRAIARVHSDFPSKFGVPRQSGLVEDLTSTLVFEPEFRSEDALRGLEGFSHLWLVWVFHQAAQRDWSPTVRPPRLGGNARMGVFATRSPFRPNPIALSAVRLDGVERTEAWGTVLRLRGADLVDGTPVLDVKPYLPYADCVPDALGGFAAAPAAPALAVDIPPDLLERVPPERRRALLGVLAQDPRPRYQKDPDRVYGFGFAGLEVRFSVADGVLTVWEIMEDL